MDRITPYQVRVADNSRKDMVARSHLELNDSGEIFDLRMAVWHHSIEGPPYRTDYMDVEIVRGMTRGRRNNQRPRQCRRQAPCHMLPAVQYRFAELHASLTEYLDAIVSMLQKLSEIEILRK